MQTIDESGNLFKNINTNGTTVVPISSILIAIVINTKGGSSNTAKAYKGQDVDPYNSIANIDTTTSIGRLNYGIPCPAGFIVVTATGTAPDLTLIYRPL